jgi:purine-binding chemotaxis protein CheW
MVETENGAATRTQHLTFSLAGEEYGVDILAVREIRGWSKVTTLPCTPVYLLGVLNLRGAVVPIVDLRCRFGMPRKEGYDNSVTIVVDVAGHLSGIVVDAVSDVRDIDRNDIRPASGIGCGIDTRHLKGLATFEDRVVWLLDVDTLLGSAFDAMALPPSQAVLAAA